jgi:hypothetical protein
MLSTALPILSENEPQHAQLRQPAEIRKIPPHRRTHTGLPVVMRGFTTRLVQDQDLELGHWDEGCEVTGKTPVGVASRGET